MTALRSFFVVAIGLALLFLVVQNTDPVRARFLWYSAEMPVILLLVVTALGGFALGLLVALFGQRRRGGGA
jgi:uncharacterized integral membrane protein